MTNFVEACPVEPVNGVCPEPTVWVQLHDNLATMEWFNEMWPKFLVLYVVLWGSNLIIRKFFVYNN